MTQQTDRLNTALAGRYRIERHLGEGGMASVYLCDDLKHDRKVALKLLKPELAAVLGAERFVVEIKTTAALQHPHILPLFDSGTAEGFLFYVMPWIQGETLRDKLTRETQLGIDEAVRIAREVLDALQYAHEHGIVHRDVKPENILLHGGHAMVADFGIALAVSAAAGGRMTETGLSLGTPHYMSPEQATAEKEITPRSDVYSLGSVLYEMLTGQPPHIGGAAQQVIMKIITAPAELVTVHRKSVPANVAAAVAKSLEKLPADRFESAKAFADALGNAGYTHATAAGHAPAAQNVSRLRVVAAVATAVAVMAILVAVWSLRVKPTANNDVVTMAFATSSGMQLAGRTGYTAVLSPDGKLVVYANMDSTGHGRLFARRLDDLQHYPIPGTENARDPIFSPDGAMIAFLDNRMLRKVPVEGGTATPIAEVPGGFYGAAWTPDGIIVSSGGTLLIVPAAGGTFVPLNPGDTTRAFMPVALPGRRMLGVTTVPSASGQAAILDLATHRITNLGFAGAPISVVDGELIYVRPDGALAAIPFDSKGPSVHGSPRVVAGEVIRGGTGMPKVSLSESGSLLYVGGSGAQQLVLVDMHGTFRPLPVPIGRSSSPRVSPDGRRVLLSVTTGGRSDVMMYDMASGAAKRMTTEGTSNIRPEWSSDGKRLIYRTDRSGDGPNITAWWKPVDESGDDRELVRMSGKGGVWQALVSPDGQYVVFRTGTVGTADIWYRRLTGDTSTKEVSATKFNEMAPQLSPDGRWITYQTDETGANEIVVRPFPGPGASSPVSVAGGISPLWSRDGRKLYYWNARQFIEATVSTSPAFRVTGRRTLFTGDYAAGQGGAAYDVMPDGASFVMTRDVENRRDEIVVVHNFRALLRSRAKGANPQ